MNKEEIKQYIKDNLSISVNTTTEMDYGKEYTIVEVKLMLEGEIISESSSSVYP